ncbi:MAG TPA: hypothetical protein VMZ71_01680, partial [Gemmataceae bacterium]|nr:hypothetical protein [Gemmataceae bacterium]
KVRVRWYKLSSDATAADWIKSLATRSPAPLAVIGGGSSDRALDLAKAMAAQTEWKGERPLLLVTTATADEVEYGGDGAHSELIDVYPGRSFRFCFTNKQMAEAVTDYVTQDPRLRPGPVVWPGLRSLTAGAAGPWPAVVAASELSADHAIKVFAIAWQDDPYSSDLSWQFRLYFQQKFGPDAPRGPHSFRSSLTVDQYEPPFSVGSHSKPNRAEAELVERVLADLPPRGERSLLILPTVAPPARRVLRTLTEGVPLIGRRLVAVTGDGISVNTIYRDGEFAWPVRSMPVPLVMFTHADPFGWDDAALRPPSSTDDVLHFAELARVVAEGVFVPADLASRFAVEEGLLTKPVQLAARFGERGPRFFDAKGNRLGGEGEFVVVLRPTIRDSRSVGKTQEDATIETYRRGAGRSWVMVKSLPIAHGKTGGRKPQ